MAGAPYEAGGIRVTIGGDPRGERRRAARGSPRRAPAEALRAGITHARDQVGLRARRRRPKRRLLRDRRASSPTTSPSSAPTSCRPSSTAAPTTTSSWSAARCSPPARRTRAGSTSSARRGAFDAEQSPRGARGRPRRRARACACTPTSSARGRACSSRSSWAPPRSTTAPTSPTPTSRRSPASDTVATFLPATDFSTRQPYPDARRVIDAGVTVALATNCNPGSSYTTSMAFCIALAVRDMRMTVDEAVRAATARRRRGAAARRRRPPRARRPRRRGRPRRALLHPPRLPPRRPPRALGAAGR